MRHFGKFLGFGLAAGLLTALAVGSASAQVRFNELLANPPGTPDNGFEFIEYRSDAPGFSMNGLTLLIIEGELGTTANPGIVDLVYTYGSADITGTNRLLLHRDSAGQLVPAPESATKIVVANFTPDIENGAQTYLLVRLKPGQTIAVGTDLDPQNDGTLDTSKFDVVFDAVGYTEEEDGEATGLTYAPQFGGPETRSTINTPDVFLRTLDGTALTSDALGASPGPYTLDPFEELLPNGDAPTWDLLLTPGRTNLPVTTFSVWGTIVYEGFNLGAEPRAVGQTVRITARPTNGDTDVTADVELISFGNDTGIGSAVGNFVISGLPVIPSNEYNVLFEDIQYFNHLNRNIVVDGIGLGANKIVTLLAGDADTSNGVDFDDFLLLADTYNLSSGDSGYDVRADFNHDSSVNFDDFLLLAANYNVAGDN